MRGAIKNMIMLRVKIDYMVLGQSCLQKLLLKKRVLYQMMLMDKNMWRLHFGKTKINTELLLNQETKGFEKISAEISAVNYELILRKWKFSSFYC